MIDNKIFDLVCRKIGWESRFVFIGLYFQKVWFNEDNNALFLEDEITDNLKEELALLAEKL